MRSSLPQTIEKYRIYEKFASGGMGSVYLGCLFAPGGFRRTVVIKRLHPHYAESADFVTAFLDEARLASRIHHPNVVSPIDVVARDGEVFLVFDHVLGLPLSTLLRLAMDRREAAPLRIVASMMIDVLRGLHAAHEARGDNDEPLGLIHRDVSPQNVLVGGDGVARLLDFGIAKAAGRAQVTAEGVVKGKPGYMAPEQMRGEVSRASDLYSAAIVLWELLANRRLFPDELSLAVRLTGARVDPPSAAREGAPAADHSPPAAGLLDAIALRGLEPEARARFATAREMAIAIEEVGVATAREVGEWVERIGQVELAARVQSVARVESSVEPPRAVEEEAAEVEAGSTAATTIQERWPGNRAARWRRPAVVAVVGALALAAAVGIFLSRQPAAAPVTRDTATAAPIASPALAPAPDSGEAVAPAQPAEAPRETKRTARHSGPPERSRSTSAERRSSRAKARGGTVRPAREEPACQATVVDKDGRIRFNEACLR